MVCLSGTYCPAARTSEPTPGACRAFTLNLLDSAGQSSLLLRQELSLDRRSLLSPPDVGNTGVNLKLKRVRARRREELGGARPATPRLRLGRSPLRTASLTTLPGGAVKARRDWSGWVQMLLSSSEWKLKARACALLATCSWCVSDLGWVHPVG